MPVPRSIRFEGHAIVTADGMIADARGAMPDGMRIPADWRRFQAALDRAVLVVLGRIGHERHRNPGRRRLVLTKEVARLSPAPDPLTTFWNPSGIGIAKVLEELGVLEGTIAIAGGTGTFEHFLPCYDVFVLSEVHGLVVPGGRPCFGAGHPRTVLAAAGLRPDRSETIDPAAGVTETTWRRPDG